MLLLTASLSGLFKWRQFDPEVILLALGWYLRSLSRTVRSKSCSPSVVCMPTTSRCGDLVQAVCAQIAWVLTSPPEAYQRQLAHGLWRTSGWKASGVTCIGRWIPPTRPSISFSRPSRTGPRPGAFSPKRLAERTIPRRGWSTPTATPRIRPPSRSSKPKAIWPRIAGIGLRHIWITCSSRTTAPSSGGLTQASIFVHSGELGARSPATKRLMWSAKAKRTESRRCEGQSTAPLHS